MNEKFSVAMQKWAILQVLSKKSQIYMPKYFEQVSERESVHHRIDLTESRSVLYECDCRKESVADI